MGVFFASNWTLPVTFHLVLSRLHSGALRFRRGHFLPDGLFFRLSAYFIDWKFLFLGLALGIGIGFLLAFSLLRQTMVHYKYRHSILLRYFLFGSRPNQCVCDLIGNVAYTPEKFTTHRVQRA